MYLRDSCTSYIYKIQAVNSIELICDLAARQLSSTSWTSNPSSISSGSLHIRSQNVPSWKSHNSLYVLPLLLWLAQRYQVHQLLARNSQRQRWKRRQQYNVSATVATSGWYAWWTCMISTMRSKQMWLSFSHLTWNLRHLQYNRARFWRWTAEPPLVNCVCIDVIDADFQWKLQLVHKTLHASGILTPS